MTAPSIPPDDSTLPAPARVGAEPRAAAAGRPIASETLFGGAKEVQIIHRGSLYRLKQTALGKLILTK